MFAARKLHMLMPVCLLTIISIYFKLAPEKRLILERGSGFNNTNDKEFAMTGTQCMTRLACLIVGCSIIIAQGLAMAIPLTLPSGDVIDLTPRQVEMLQRSPGVYYFDLQTDKFLDMRLRHWVLLELPPALGSGYIVATPDALAQGLDMIRTDGRSTVAKPSSMMRPDAYVSTVGIEQTKSRDTEKFNGQDDWQWTFDMGYRIDDLDWSIAGNAPPAFGGNYVNVLSELTWSDLEIIQLEFSFRKTFTNRYTLKGSLAYGLIFDGENQDSDYAGNNRTAEFSRSNNSADDGNTWDGSIGLGYYIPFLSDTLRVTPLAGFSFHAQNLTITDGFQTIPPAGAFPGLDSSYDARWYGPWLGVEFYVKNHKTDGVSRAYELLLGIEYHWADYDADANWNLRADFAHPKSFEHEADGAGIIFWAGYQYYFNPQWSLNFKGRYQTWETDSGTDRVFFADGSEIETRLNEVNWKSFSLAVGVTRSF
jgi:hypothetical protein